LWKFTIDFGARIIKKRRGIVTANRVQFISPFMKNEGRVLTHRFVLKEIWGIAYQTETQYLRVFVATLRKKIEENPNQPRHIITESGLGYRFI
jgi:two-component system KDP operon response regulator KdpE